MRVALVSGAARGLGAAIAERLGAEGWTLSLGVRDAAAARARFPGAHVGHCDADLPGTEAAWVASAAAEFGRIDALVANAGIYRRVGFEPEREADLDAMWRANVKGAWRLIAAALPHLRATGRGRIVTIASTDGKRYRDASVSAGYAMTKHALVALTHAARHAGWEAGVRATALCPGAIDTELLAGLPGVTPPASRLRPGTVADMVATLLALPNEAVVAELVMNTRLESTL